ncbi:MAG: HesA/MoeB/ThiF family protein, partial [Flavobacteriaceae bacterium]|nr:HesA/MoeB/ThiF family protein [Flavobacteriaceae bacterium]
MERYTRQIKLNEVGLTGQVKLSKSRVLIVGAGGLGCPVGIYLSAAGIGHISLVDHDIISTSNLNRQVLFGKADVGKLKVEVARQKMLLQNDSIDVTAIPYRIDLHNAMKLISGSDLVIDCTDNLPTRYLLSDACELANKPLVFGGIHKFQIQMSVLNHTQRISYRDI